MEKRINAFLINKVDKVNETIIVDVDFGLTYHSRFSVLDRLLTAEYINLKYNSEIDAKPCISIKTKKGTTIEGFNLKNKHIKEIKAILANSEYTVLNMVGELL